MRNPKQPNNCDVVAGDEWKEGIKYYIVPALITLFLLKVVFNVFFVPSGSMVPTIKENSLHLTWRLPYIFGNPEPERGDIVVFRKDDDKRNLVKRVIGISGDKVRISGGMVYINGSPAEEPYLPEGTYTEGEGTYLVPDGMVILLGDNRNDSVDSRYWTTPYISVKNIRAKFIDKFPNTTYK